MHGNCKWAHVVLAVLIFVFAVWPTQIVSQMYSTWIIAIAAVLIFIHALACRKCAMCESCGTEMPSNRRRSRRR